MRFNFSKSGIGVSAGFKGFRVGTGPRGNYVSIGANGVRFRQSLNTPKREVHEPNYRVEPADLEPSISPNVERMQEIESGNVLEMGDSSAADLLAELNGKRRKSRIFPLVLCISLMGLPPLFFLSPIWMSLSWITLSIVLCKLARTRDILKKTSVLFYELSPEAELAYERLHQWFDEMCRRSHIWHISAVGDVIDKKYVAGADSLFSRSRIAPGKSQIDELKTNVDYPVIPVGRQKLALMPERILVFDTHGVGAVAYSDLYLDVEDSNFIEEETLPHDAEVIGQTWKYVNKKGGPDLRFKDNYEIPIARYEKIHFKSETGLNELVQVSQPGVGEPLSQCFNALAHILLESKQDSP